MLPEPWAVMSSSRFRSPALSVISIGAFPPVVWTPVPPMFRPLVSRRKIPPLVVVASTVFTVISSGAFASELSPIAPVAFRESVTPVVMLTVVSSVASSIVPVAVRLTLPLVEVMLSTVMPLAAALSVMSPFVD